VAGGRGDRLDERLDLFGRPPDPRQPTGQRHRCLVPGALAGPVPAEDYRGSQSADLAAQIVEGDVGGRGEGVPLDPLAVLVDRGRVYRQTAVAPQLQEHGPVSVFKADLRRLQGGIDVINSVGSAGRLPAEDPAGLRQEDVSKPSGLFNIE